MLLLMMKSVNLIQVSVIYIVPFPPIISTFALNFKTHIKRYNDEENIGDV